MRCTADTDIPQRLGGVGVTIFHGVVDMAMLLLVICFNSLIVFAILRYHRKLKLAGLLPCPHQASVRLVLSLSTSDICVALSSLYFLTFEYSCSVYAVLGSHRVACLARFVPFISAASVSCYTIIALAIDRYIAVVHPMRYRDTMTSRTTNTFIAVIWTCGIATGSSLIFWNNWSASTPCEESHIIPSYFVTVLCGSVLTVTIVVLASLHFRVHREAQAMSVRKKSLGSVRHSLQTTNAHIHSLNSKSARVVYLVMGCIFVLWTPILVIVMLKTCGFKSQYIDLAYGIAFSINTLSYFVNSFVYAWKNTTVKLAICYLFGKFTKKQRFLMSVKSNGSAAQYSISSNNFLMMSPVFV